jgi:hypothetical protein
MARRPDLARHSCLRRERRLSCLRRGRIRESRRGKLALGARDLALALPLILEPHLHLPRRHVELLCQLPPRVEPREWVERVNLL